MAMTLSRVGFRYGESPVLRDLDAVFPERGVVCLSGPSGCGKTTLLRLLAGLETPTEGTITGLPARPAVLFQENRLLPWETARGNLRLIASDETARRWLAAVGLAAEADESPRRFSGGMRRRLALARALAFDGDALFLDEPFNGVDRERVADLAAILRGVGRQKPVILVSHTPEDAALLGAAVWRLSGSPVTALVPEGAPAEA